MPSLKDETVAELQQFLDTQEADFGLTDRAQRLVSFICQEDDEAFRVFSNVIIPSPPSAKDKDKDDSAVEPPNHAARSYRAMSILKADINSTTFPSIIVTTNEQAGLLAKDLISSLANVKHQYTTIHIRELLDALLEKFPEKVLGAAASGGKQGVQEYLEPLFISPVTLSVLTNLVCYGCTGRQGMPSAEKSATHTAMYHHPSFQQQTNVSAGARKKFVRQMAEFQLFDRLASSLREETSGEEVCEAILTILEVVGYPPVGIGTSAQVGEDFLLSPLASTTWWKELLLFLDTEPHVDKKESVARTLHSAFALATGNSSRIVKSHAPATDATEQTSEAIIQEKEEKISNRLVEWDLTEKMHVALLEELPLLLRALHLPSSNIMNFQATDIDAITKNSKSPSSSTTPGTIDASSSSSSTLVQHPGRYRTVPIGSWRVQLLSLLKEIMCYRGKDYKTNKAMDAIMELPLPPELQKVKKQKSKTAEEIQSAAEDEKDTKEDDPLYNPWPALCSFVFAYPYNDFYHNIFYQMLQAVVLEHHEPTLRVIFQKSKFLSRALRSLTTSNALKGLIIRTLNLLRLRSQSLPPNAFLTQYLGSHDLWKEDVEQLLVMTMNQETPIRLPPGAVEAPLDIELGSAFANKLGLAGISKWDGTVNPAVDEGPLLSAEQPADADADAKKKKRTSKKKKKKK